MINKSTYLILCTLILLTLPACLPQSEVEQPQQPIDTATYIPPPDTPPPSASPLATHSAEELIMPQDSTDQPPEPIETQPPEPTSDTQPGKPSPESAFQPAVQNWINQAKEDLAARQNLAVEQIEYLSFENKVWSDSSLGCPQPGMRYLQVLKEGYLIRLSTGDHIYNYHGGGYQDPFLCELTSQLIPLTTT